MKVYAMLSGDIHFKPKPKSFSFLTSTSFLIFYSVVILQVNFSVGEQLEDKVRELDVSITEKRREIGNIQRKLEARYF